MKIFLAILAFTLSACSTNQVNVDMDSCQQRGVVDGVKIGKCKEAKMVK
jgi:hypothetical protein